MFSCLAAFSVSGTQASSPYNLTLGASIRHVYLHIVNPRLEPAMHRFCLGQRRHTLQSLSRASLKNRDLIRFEQAERHTAFCSTSVRILTTALVSWAVLYVARAMSSRIADQAFAHRTRHHRPNKARALSLRILRAKATASASIRYPCITLLASTLATPSLANREEA